MIAADGRGVGVERFARHRRAVSVDGPAGHGGQLLRMISSPPITPGKFITSANPCATPSRRSAAMSSAPMAPPLLAIAVAGTQLGAMMTMCSGDPHAASAINRTPAGPATFAISCGSVTTVVTPCGNTAAANWAGTHRLLSM